MPYPYQNAVCRGSLLLKTGCGHCERCMDERVVMQAKAEKSDAHQIATELPIQVANLTTAMVEGPITAKHIVLTDFSLKEDGTRNSASEELIVDASLTKLNALELAATKLDSQLAPSPIKGHSGLPVAGYAKTVEQWKIDMVNENKILEEKVLRRVDEHVRPRGDESIDGASVQIARRHVEDAFYRLNRAIMQPKRLTGDL